MLFYGSHAFYERAGGGWLSTEDGGRGDTGFMELAARGPQRSQCYKGPCLLKPRPVTKKGRDLEHRRPLLLGCASLWKLHPMFRGQLTWKRRGQKPGLVGTQQCMLSWALVCLEIQGSRKIFKYKNIFLKVMSLNYKIINTFFLATQPLGLSHISLN